jgi:putative DNA primase/helicase
LEIDETTNQGQTHPSEKRMADIFAEREGNQFRYVAAWGQWWQWTGTCWKAEATLLVLNRIAAICQELSRDAATNHEIRNLGKHSTISGVERIARAHRQFAAKTEQWNTDPWLLNTPEGVIDLRTKKMRPADPTDYMTKETGVAALKGATPVWDAHLKKVFADDQELIAYWYRVLGYCLTGSVREKAFFFCYGEGNNGKSTTMRLLRFIFGSYGHGAHMDMFTYKKFGHDHPTELTGLFGARFVTGTETERSRGWSEARLKDLTGGDPIEARKMRQDWFEFMPTHKLMFSGNYRPSLRSVGVAMRSRVNLIPFTVIIPKTDQLDLDEQLKAEAPRILYKMIEGCREWQREGLKPPEKVTQATDDYMDAEDSLALWFDECVTPGNENDGAFTEEIYPSYRTWMQNAGETPMIEKSFVAELEARASEFNIVRSREKITVKRKKLNDEGKLIEVSVRRRGFLGIKEVTQPIPRF